MDDIELVLFESQEISNIPTPEMVRDLASLAAGTGLSYTVHLPLDTQTGSADEAVRRRSVKKHRDIIQRMSPLKPFAYVCHLHGDRRGKAPAQDPEAWAARHARSVEELMECVEPRDLCIETLDYPFSLVEDIVFRFGLSVCLDVGHLLVHGYDLERHLDRYWEKTRIVHLHGVHEGEDHKDASHFPAPWLKSLMGRLNQENAPPRVCTLEIFNQQDLEKSLEAIKPYEPMA